MSIAHILLTRFNVRVGYSQNRHLDPIWLAERFALFEQYCLPSVLAQTVTPDRWLVLFDERTPLRFRSRIGAYRCEGLLEPVFVGDFEKLDLDELIRSRLAPSVDRVMTSRIDNDDALAHSYCERVRRYAISIEHDAVLNMPRGFVFHHQSAKLFARAHLSNPFLSVIETLTGGQKLHTVFGREHNDWSSTLPILQLSNEPGWLVVVHGRNVSNSLHDGRRVALASARHWFSAPVLPAGSRFSLTHHGTNLLRFGRRSLRRLLGLGRLLRSIRPTNRR